MKQWFKDSSPQTIAKVKQTFDKIKEACDSTSMIVKVTARVLPQRCADSNTLAYSDTYENVIHVCSMWLRMADHNFALSLFSKSTILLREILQLPDCE